MSFDGDTKGRQIIEAFKDEAKDKTGKRGIFYSSQICILIIDFSRHYGT